MKLAFVETLDDLAFDVLKGMGRLRGFYCCSLLEIKMLSFRELPSFSSLAALQFSGHDSSEEP